jgi:hypothetical protein
MLMLMLMLLLMLMHIDEQLLHHSVVFKCASTNPNPCIHRYLITARKSSVCALLRTRRAMCHLPTNRWLLMSLHHWEPRLPSRLPTTTCTCILERKYVAAVVVAVLAHALVDLTPALPSSMSCSASQVDSLWDDVESRKQMVDLMHEQISKAIDRSAVPDAHYDIRTIRYPLSPGLRDIVWKFNAIIMQVLIRQARLAYYVV